MSRLPEKKQSAEPILHEIPTPHIKQATGSAFFRFILPPIVNCYVLNTTNIVGVSECVYCGNYLQLYLS